MMDSQAMPEEQRRVLEKIIKVARARGQNFKDVATAYDLSDKAAMLMEEYAKEMDQRDDVIASIGKALGPRAIEWKRLIAKECLGDVGEFGE